MTNEVRRQIFFADLDGTLLNDEKVITPKTKKAIEEFTGAGNYFVINSGRPLQSCIHVIEDNQLHYPNMYIVAYNGACIYDYSHGKMVTEETLSIDMIQYLMDTAEDMGIHCHTYTEQSLVSYEDTKELKFYQINVHMPAIITRDLRKALENEPCKAIAISIDNREALESYKQKVENETEGGVQCIFSNPRYLELFSKNAGKEKGLLWLCRFLNVRTEDTMAAGDEANDISMIETAGLGIAMLNGTEDVKRAGDVITEKDNNQDGLVPFLLMRNHTDD